MTSLDEQSISQEVRRVLDQYGRLSVPMAELADSDELYRVGMTSHAAVSVMLALEAAFKVQFPDAMLRQNTFSSVDAIAAAVGLLIKFQTGDGLDPLP
ncbi:MAG: acyl carrier protein [Acidimicrobiales bacterium]